MKKNIIIFLLALACLIMLCIIIDWAGRFKAMKVLLETYQAYYG